MATGPRGGDGEVFIDGASQGRIEFFRNATDPSHPDNSGKTDLIFGVVASYPVTQGQHTFRLDIYNDIYNDSAAVGTTKRDMIYVDGFVIYGGSQNGAATIRESSSQTQGNVSGSGASATPSSSPGNTLLLTGVLEVPAGVNLDLDLVSPLGTLVSSSTGLNATEVVRYVPTVAGTFSFKVLNMGTTASAYTLYTITTKSVVAAPKTAAVVVPEEEKPKAYALEQNYPNPFNPSTVIRYALPASGHVTLKVYNILGEEVATLVDGTEQAGYKSVTFDASRLASGLYIYKLAANEFTSVRRLVVIK
jgi:hypothetical protein